MEILATFAVLALAIFKLFPEATRKRRPRRITRGVHARRALDQISGTAFITDGDGLRVNGYIIRMTGLDAPEHDQLTQRWDREWFNHGRRVKSALIGKVGGKDVEVLTHDHDKHGRVIGTVFCDGEDVNKWLVLRGYAIAAYEIQYSTAEKWSRKKGLGMWGYAQTIDPRAWRHRTRRWIMSRKIHMRIKQKHPKVTGSIRIPRTAFVENAI